MQQEKKVILLGDMSVGKTSILRRWIADDFSTQEPTIGVQHTSKTVNVNGKEVKLSIWDTAGQERYESLAPVYIRGASLAMIIVDASSPKSFTSITKWVKIVSEDPTIILYLVVNKIDLVESDSWVQKQIDAFGDKFKANFCVSAKTGENVNLLFDTCADDVSVVDQQQDYTPPIPNDEKEKSDKKCC
ncbi:ras-related protein Rab-5C [Histomonas meleagridis]|uniref:ras-related protein Rab-5C n=1 Tax=Histomonas meleagridis TaxID=135588 RepID=UPI00355A9F9F|nr:ras-related protein Rab-5C [Histomonas meleagridis]KAH0797920.1 ras-related protein Rab-5C [Histomonas meleagridis]